MELESNRKYTDEEEAWALGSFAIFSLHLNNRISGQIQYISNRDILNLLHLSYCWHGANSA